MIPPRDLADDLRRRFRAELEALNRDGRDLAVSNRGLADELQHGDAGFRDAHVRLLTQSFAFLSARLHQKLDDDLPEISSALVSALHPELVAPVPSMVMAELQLNTNVSIPAAGRRIDREKTEFYFEPGEPTHLRFRPTSSVTLWPITIQSVRLERYSDSKHEEAVAALCVRLEAIGSHRFGKIDLGRLRFFVKGESRVAYALHEALCTAVIACIGRLDSGASFELDPDSQVGLAGFDDDDRALEGTVRTFAGFRLLQEYFAMPEKFRFFEVRGVADKIAGRESKGLELRFILRRDFELKDSDIDRDTLSLSCVPLVNLFPRPHSLRVGPRQSTYQIEVEPGRGADFEVYRVSRVFGRSLRDGSRARFAEFYSVRHDLDELRAQGHPDDSHPPVSGGESGSPVAYWHAGRAASLLHEDGGDDTTLTVYFPGASRGGAMAEAHEFDLHIDLLCTNRDRPRGFSGWSKSAGFKVKGIEGIASIRCLDQPTPALRSGIGAKSDWRLISLLALDYLSLDQGDGDVLRDVLSIYNFEPAASNDRQRTIANQQQISRGIHSVKSELAMRRLQLAEGPAMCRGTATRLNVDRRFFNDGSPFLLAAVIERFLALSSPISSFSEVTLWTMGAATPDHRFPARSGRWVLK